MIDEDETNKLERENQIARREEKFSRISQEILGNQLERANQIQEGGCTIEICHLIISLYEILTINQNVPIGILEGLESALGVPNTSDELNLRSSTTCPWVTEQFIGIQIDNQLDAD